MINEYEQTNQKSETNKTDKHDGSEEKKTHFQSKKSNQIMSDLHPLRFHWASA